MTDTNQTFLANVNRNDNPTVILEEGVSYSAIVAALSDVTLPDIYFQIDELEGDSLLGDFVSEVLIGNEGADHIEGGYGDDVLVGGAGNDILDGGRGSDLLIGGAGNDILIMDSDAGEPEVGQNYDPNAGRNDEIDPLVNQLYANQAFIADDVMVGGSGADTFLIKPQINAKLDIIMKHTGSDGRINWAAVAGENNNVHDHWVDSIGTDVIADYSKADGDKIQLYGHTVDPEIVYEDVDGDGDVESIIKIYSNQANGGAHDDDFLGQVIVHGDLVTEEDISIKAKETYGVVETIHELTEAVYPDGVKDNDVQSTQSENPYLAPLDTRDADDAPNSSLEEQIYSSYLEKGADRNLVGQGGDDLLEGDIRAPSSSSLDSPLSFWSLSSSNNGVFEDPRGTSNAMFYIQDNGEATLRDGLGEIIPMPGPNGGQATMFGVTEKSFAYVAHSENYEVLNGTVSAWFNPTSLSGRRTIISKDESSADGGGHFYLAIVEEGLLKVRFAEGEGKNDSGYNHEWVSNGPLVSLGQWQHIAATFGADGVTVYLDGQALDDAAFTKIAGAGLEDSEVSNNLSDFHGSYLIGNDKPFIIGANSYSSKETDTAEAIGVDECLKDFFEGGIADVGFWGGDTPADALNALQIAELYTNGLGDVINAPAAQEAILTYSDDTLSGEGGNDLLDGGAGDDVLNGGTGDDTLLGGYGDDVLNGNQDNDILEGGHGSDVLRGNEGNDIIISRSDDREPEIAQFFDHSDDPYFEVSFADRMLYPSQKNMSSNDDLYGGDGADEFVFEILINAKERIINKHVNDDRTIDWKGVTGENKYVHDHWVDGIGHDTIHDFDMDEGDTLSISGHTTEVYRIEYADVNLDGSVDTILHVWSNQGNAGAHNKDLLGTITVLDNLLQEDDFSQNAHANHGIVDTIDEYKEAVMPLMLRGQDAGDLPNNDPPVTNEFLDLGTASFVSYNGTQDAGGNLNVIESGLGVELTGNAWKRMELDYDITQSTVLTFEYLSTTEGEVQGFGLETDDNFKTGANSFQLNGMDSPNFFIRDYTYTDVGSWQTFSINVGHYQTGHVDWFTFINDHDNGAQDGSSAFRNIALSEDGTAPPSPAPIDVDFSTASFVSYNGSQDVGGSVSVIEGGAGIEIQGNAWKRMELDYNISDNTVLSFEYLSTVEGEVQSIGLETDNNFKTGANSFQLNGTDFPNFFIRDYEYTDVGNWQTFTINVGDYQIGNVNWLTFINDHDNGAQDGVGAFRNVSLYEDTSADAFIFDAASAFNDVEVIDDFQLSENDTLDISDLLESYDPLTDAITDYVQITDNGTDSAIAVDANGGADNFSPVALVTNAVGLTDEEVLESSGVLITI